MAVLILIPAAGASRRMRGRDKLLEQIGGTAILRRAADAAMATGEPVLVTLPEGDAARRAVLAGLGVALQAVDGAEGMAASIRAGAMAATRAGAEALLVSLPDMPEIDEGALRALLASWRADPSHPYRAAAEDGTPGNPVVLPARLFAALAAVTGDSGAREVLRAEAPRLCPLPGRAALTDLDTPEAWAEWRKGPSG